MHFATSKASSPPWKRDEWNFLGGKTEINLFVKPLPAWTWRDNSLKLGLDCHAAPRLLQHTAHSEPLGCPLGWFQNSSCKGTLKLRPFDFLVASNLIVQPLPAWTWRENSLKLGLDCHAAQINLLKIVGFQIKIGLAESKFDLFDSIFIYIFRLLNTLKFVALIWSKMSKALNAEKVSIHK